MPVTVPAASADISANANRAAAAGSESTAALALAATAGKPTSASALVTPTRAQKTKRGSKSISNADATGSSLTSSTGSSANSATASRAIVLADIKFHRRTDAVAALQSLTGSKTTVPKTLKGIIRAILSVYSVDELKPFWTHTFGVDAKWPKKQKALTQFVTALASAGVSGNSTEIKPTTVLVE